MFFQDDNTIYSFDTTPFFRYPLVKGDAKGLYILLQTRIFLITCSVFGLKIFHQTR